MVLKGSNRFLPEEQHARATCRPETFHDRISQLESPYTSELLITRWNATNTYAFH